MLSRTSLVRMAHFKQRLVFPTEIKPAKTSWKQNEYLFFLRCLLVYTGPTVG